MENKIIKKDYHTMKTFYKFYKANHLYIEDVFQKSRLFMTDYKGMWNENDDSEGKYWIDPTVSKSLREKVKQEKQNLMICCVTNKLKNAQMWRAFADDGNGICISVHVVDNNIKQFRVTYIQKRPYITQSQFEEQSPEQVAEEILKHKLITFSNEKETRILRQVSDGRTTDFLSVKIDRLYIGWNVTTDKESEFRKYAKNANVKVIKLHKPIL